MDVRALVIQSDGTGVIRSVGSEDLTAVQELIGGGYLEALYGLGWHLFVDEEGQRKGLPRNAVASTLADRLGLVAPYYLLGTVVFLGNTTDGRLADVPEHVVREWESL